MTIFTSFILPFWAQVLVWALFSILSIRLIRPRLIERLHNGGEDRLSNIDALIGEIDALPPKLYEISTHPWTEDAYPVDELKAILDAAETRED